MGEPAEGKPLRTWKRPDPAPAAGGRVMGVAGLALASVVPTASEATEPSLGVAGTSRVPSPPGTPTEPSAPGAPDQLAVDGLAVPIGLSPGDVYFAWQVRDAARREPERLSHPGIRTGRRAGPGADGVGQWPGGLGQTGLCTLRGPAAGFRLRLPWTVRTWDHYSGNSRTESPRRCSRPGSRRATGGLVDRSGNDCIVRAGPVHLRPPEATLRRVRHRAGPGHVSATSSTSST